VSQVERFRQYAKARGYSVTVEQAERALRAAEQKRRYARAVQARDADFLRDLARRALAELGL
jgi:hypothetical protein